MSAHKCHNCGERIPHGLAVLRSRSFVLVALCRWCAGTGHSPVTQESVTLERAS
jgi:hypothetical protein